MRATIHAIAIALAILAMLLQLPSVRTGDTTIMRAMVQPVVALFITYAVLIGVVGAATGTPLAKWPQLWKQLFRREGGA